METKPVNGIMPRQFIVFINFNPLKNGGSAQTFGYRVPIFWAYQAVDYGVFIVIDLAL